MFIGFGAVLVGEQLGFSARIIALVVVGALGLECLAHGVDSLWLWYSQGTPPFSISRLTGSKERISYVNNLFFSILAAEFVARVCFAKRFLPIAQKWLYAGAAIVYFNSWIIGARNGEIGALVLTFSVAVFVLYGRRVQIGGRNLFLGGIGVLLFVLFLGYAGYRSDGRWGTLLEQASMGWQTDTYRYWINAKKYPIPVDKEGREVNQSNYLRIAWIKEGAKIVADTPWGVGYGRTAFGHDDEGQGQGNAEGGVLDAFLESDKGGGAAHNGAVIAGQAAVADQAEGGPPGFDAVDAEFQTAGHKPGKKRRQGIGHGRVPLFWGRGTIRPGGNILRRPPSGLPSGGPGCGHCRRRPPVPVGGPAVARTACVLAGGGCGDAG